MSYIKKRLSEPYIFIKIFLWGIMLVAGLTEWIAFHTLTYLQDATIAIILAVTMGAYAYVTHLEGKLAPRDRTHAYVLIVTLLVAAAILAIQALK